MPPEIVQGRTDTRDMPCTIGTERGQVVMGFPQMISRFSIGPVPAAQMARHMIDCAKKLGADVQLIVEPRQLKPEHIEVMVTRAMHVIRSGKDQHRKVRAVATDIVQAVLKEVL